MTAWQGDISWQEVTSHSYKPDTRNQRSDRAATAQSDHCMSPLVLVSPCVPMLHIPINDHIDKINMLQNISPAKADTYFEQALLTNERTTLGPVGPPPAGQ